MVNFNSTPQEQPDLVKAQWFGDSGAGVRRGVDPEVAADLGYIDPETLPTANPPETWTEDKEVDETSNPKSVNYAGDHHDSGGRKSTVLMRDPSGKGRSSNNNMIRDVADGASEQHAKSNAYSNKMNEQERAATREAEQASGASSPISTIDNPPQ